jgi:hypothetical protein
MELDKSEIMSEQARDGGYIKQWSGYKIQEIPLKLIKNN